MKPPISYWHDSLEPGDRLEPRAALPGDRQADIAIVGAGFAGLWTAYYLLQANPSLRIVVIEAETAGFGASGRNGGWAVPEAGAPLDVLDREGGVGTGATMMREMFRAVDEIGDVTRRESIDCGYAKGGALWLSSDAGQFDRQKPCSLDTASTTPTSYSIRRGRSHTSMQRGFMAASTRRMRPRYIRRGSRVVSLAPLSGKAASCTR